MFDNQAIARTEPSLEAMQQAAPPPEFADFYGAGYRRLMVTVMAVGATPEEAHDAVQSAMEEVLGRWDQIAAPLAYAKKAALSSFYRERTRGLDRIRERLAQRAEARCDGAGLNVWEDRQWVTQILGSLPSAQREELALVVDGFTPTQIAQMLGKNSDAVRQNLRGARTRLRLSLLNHDRVAQRSGQSPAEPATEGGP